MLKSDLIFITKEGLQQFEEILECRYTNAYRNKKVPVIEPLSYKKYIGEYKPKSRQDPDYTEIIKPTLMDESLQNDKHLKVLVPSVKQYLSDLKNH